METRDFFISYTREDLNWAKRVVEILERNGYTTYYQERDSSGNFIRWMNKAVKVSRNFIIIWSKAANESNFCKRECDIASKREIEGHIKLFLPVYIENAPTDDVIELYNHINLYGLNPVETEKKLLWGVRNVEPSKPAQKPNDQPLKDVQKIDEGTKYYNMGENSYYAQDYEKAREYWEQAAEKGNADALYNLGILYEHGLGVEQDYDKAREYYEKAIATGDEYIKQLATDNLNRLPES